MTWVMLMATAEREADALSNAVKGKRTSTLAYELRKTLAELRSELYKMRAAQSAEGGTRDE